MMEGYILRLRPRSVLADGFSEERLTSLLQALTGTAIEPPSVTIGIAFGTSTDDPYVADHIADAIVEFCSEPALLVIDMAFGTDVFRGLSMCDVLLHNAFVEVADKLHAESRIIVLADELPTQIDMLFEAIQNDVLSAKICIIDAEFNYLGNPDFVDMAQITEQLSLSFDENVEDLRRSTLRRRGVFEYKALSSPPSYYLFHYDPLQPVHEVLVDFLKDHFEAVHADLVVFESSNTGDWFSSCIKSACLGHRPCVDSAHLAAPAASADRSVRTTLQQAQATLADQTRRICFVVPAFRTGGSLMRLFDLTGRVSFANASFFAIYCETTDRNPQCPANSFGEISLQRGGASYQLNYILSVPMRPLDSQNWKVKAAIDMNEVQKLGNAHFSPDADIKPTHVAMWSLFEDYSVGPETPVPSVPGRDSIMHFPLLGDMNEWDSYWLAEASVRHAVSLQKCAREGLLVVVPDEESGARPLAEALTERCVTAVLRVARPVIDGQEALPAKISSTLRDNSASSIVVLDESTVTYSTLQKLCEIVKEVTGRGPDLLGAIVDLSDEGGFLGLDHFSFARWRPLLYLSDGRPHAAT
jgi:hypothetical protein